MTPLIAVNIVKNRKDQEGNSKLDDKYSERENAKMMLMCLEFTESEFMQLFIEFAKAFDENMDFQFDIRELVSIIGKFMTFYFCFT